MPPTHTRKAIYLLIESKCNFYFLLTQWEITTHDVCTIKSKLGVEIATYTVSVATLREGLTIEITAFSHEN